jgi:hypothetical protein
MTTTIRSRGGPSILKVLQLILFFVVSAKAWTRPSLPQPLLKLYHKTDSSISRDLKAHPTPKTNTPRSESLPSSRRKFLETPLLLTSCIATTLIVSSPANAGDDPFAQIDSIASSFSDRSSMAPQLSSSPSRNDESNFSGSKKDTSPTTSQNNDSNFQSGQAPASGNLSEMEAALQDARKQRRIDPRTHG